MERESMTLSERLKQAADETRRVLDTEPWPPSREDVEAYHELLSDAVRLAELVKAWQEATAQIRSESGDTADGHPRPFYECRSFSRYTEAVKALLAFDLSGTGE
jgi:hypothetical protein